MQKEYTERFSEFYQRISKPVSRLAELNIKTLRENMEMFNDFLHAKKPEEMASAQLRLVNAMGFEAFKYAQEASKIYMEAASETNEVFTDYVQKAAKTARNADIEK